MPLPFAYEIINMYVQVYSKDLPIGLTLYEVMESLYETKYMLFTYVFFIFYFLKGNLQNPPLHTSIVLHTTSHLKMPSMRKNLVQRSTIHTTS